MRRWGVLLGVCLLLAATCLAPRAQGQPDPEDLVQRLGCQGCHRLKGKGRFRAPALDAVGGRLSAEVIRQQLISPRGRMPNYKHLRPEELDAVVLFLSGLK